MKLESLKNEKFGTLSQSNLSKVIGGQTNSSGVKHTEATGTVEYNGKQYKYTSDCKDGNRTGYWVSELVRYVWP